MEVIISIFTVAFIALLLGSVLTFGFTLLLIVIATATLAGLFALLAEVWRRWRFVKSATSWEEKRTSVIEGDYEDVSDDQE